jgi:hypothetical protein
MTPATVIAAPPVVQPHRLRRAVAVVAVLLLVAVGFAAAMALGSAKRDTRPGVCSETCTTSLTPAQRLEARSSR